MEPRKKVYLLHMQWVAEKNRNQQKQNCGAQKGTVAVFEKQKADFEHPGQEDTIEEQILQGKICSAGKCFQKLNLIVLGAAGQNK